MQSPFAFKTTAAPELLTLGRGYKAHQSDIKVRILVESFKKSFLSFWYHRELFEKSLSKLVTVTQKVCKSDGCSFIVFPQHFF